MDMNLLKEYRDNFWGDNVNTLSSNDKRDKIHSELEVANREYFRLLGRGEIEQNDDTPFAFVAGGRRFCEKAYVNLLGLADNTGHKGKTWRKVVKKFTGIYTFINKYVTWIFHM
jgi:hypothetical protein